MAARFLGMNARGSDRCARRTVNGPGPGVRQIGGVRGVEMDIAGTLCGPELVSKTGCQRTEAD